MVTIKTDKDIGVSGSIWCAETRMQTVVSLGILTKHIRSTALLCRTQCLFNQNLTKASMKSTMILHFYLTKVQTQKNNFLSCLLWNTIGTATLFNAFLTNTKQCTVTSYIKVGKCWLLWRTETWGLINKTCVRTDLNLKSAYAKIHSYVYIYKNSFWRGKESLWQRAFFFFFFCIGLRSFSESRMHVLEMIVRCWMSMDGFYTTFYK